MIRSAAMAILLATTVIAQAAEGEKFKADPAQGKALAEAICVACHGADGNSEVPDSPTINPKLAGQVEEYLYKQLSNFVPVGDKPALRDNPIMFGMAATLDEEGKRNVAAWFASQKLNPAVVQDQSRLPLGQRLWRQGDHKKGIPACAGCHGPAGAGMPAQYPRLAGQFPEYTAIQLKAFRLEERGNDPEKMMRMIAAKLSDAEIQAVSEYAASLR
ncbi:MAG: cytochrome c4 [Azonexus sp.]|jgi:cytochrome c553|nr:cytochrome c4 [Azonexus sp.]